MPCTSLIVSRADLKLPAIASAIKIARAFLLADIGGAVRQLAAGFDVDLQGRALQRKFQSRRVNPLQAVIADNLSAIHSQLGTQSPISPQRNATAQSKRAGFYWPTRLITQADDVDVAAAHDAGRQ